MTLDEQRTAFLEAILARDSSRARRVIDTALSAGAPVPDLYLGVLEPAMREVGHRWAIGVINVAEEHYATVIAQSILDGLSRALPRAPARRPARDRERHTGRAARARRTDGRGLPRGRRLGGAAARGGRRRWRTSSALVASEQPELVALSTATAGVLDGVAAMLQRAARPLPSPAAWSPAASSGPTSTSPTALELGADARRPGPARSRRPAARVGPARRVRTTETLRKVPFTRGHFPCMNRT